MSTAGIAARLDYASPIHGENRILLVMLPGAGIRAQDFAAEGMVDTTHAHPLPIDIAVVEPELALYLEDGIADALHKEIACTALDLGYRRVWLLGISLGGMGALLYASTYPGNVEGIILLAPFLGTRGTMAVLGRDGGFQPDREHLATTSSEQRVLAWLTAHLKDGANAPSLYLGYARQDRFSHGHRLLADRLPPERTAIRDGVHDWNSWTALWGDILERPLFCPTGRRQ